MTTAGPTTAPVLAAEEFEPYGPSHLAVVMLLAIGCAVLVTVGRRHRGTPAADRFRRWFAAVLTAVKKTTAR